jgi:ferredoxin-NADP reductase
MASPRSTLRIAADERIGAATRALDVVRTDGAPWSNVRGKYVILDTGLVLPDGKAVKRAYSLAPVQGEEGRCRLVVKRLGGGPGSDTLHAAPIGAEFSFSGPWGKLVPETGLEGATLFVATDTGITSALGVAGLLQEQPLTVLWLRAPDECFFDVERARAAIAAAGARFMTATIPAVGSARRAELAWAHVDACVAEHAPQVLLAAGDGDVVFPLTQWAFPPATVRGVRIECFFHNPERKSA